MHSPFVFALWCMNASFLLYIKWFIAIFYILFNPFKPIIKIYSEKRLCEEHRDFIDNVAVAMRGF